MHIVKNSSNETFWHPNQQVQNYTFLKVDLYSAGIISMISGLAALGLLYGHVGSHT